MFLKKNKTAGIIFIIALFCAASSGTAAALELNAIRASDIGSDPSLPLPDARRAADHDLETNTGADSGALELVRQGGKIYISPDGGTVSSGGRMRTTLSLDELRAQIHAAPPGSEFLFAKGLYRAGRAIQIEELHDIVFRGEDGAVFDAGMKRPVVKLDWAEDGLSWKPVYANFADPANFAIFRVKNSSGIKFENLNLRNSWPNVIALYDSSGISVTKCAFRDGTNAIFAKGARTTGIYLADNSWDQDPTGGIWSEADWSMVHHGSLNYFNGAFLQSLNIAGQVVIERNTIRNAYNAIRVKVNNKPGGCAAAQMWDYECPLSTDLRIRDNKFYNISDNVVEIENWAKNVDFERNEMRGFYAPISLDGAYGENMRFIDNIFIPTERPRNNVPVCYDGGSCHNQTLRIFKLYSGDTDDAGGIPIATPVYYGPMIRNLVFRGSFPEMTTDGTRIGLTESNGEFPEGFVNLPAAQEP